MKMMNIWSRGDGRARVQICLLICIDPLLTSTMYSNYENILLQLNVNLFCSQCSRIFCHFDFLKEEREKPTELNSFVETVDKNYLLKQQVMIFEISLIIDRFKEVEKALHT